MNQTKNDFLRRDFLKRDFLDLCSSEDDPVALDRFLDDPNFEVNVTDPLEEGATGFILACKYRRFGMARVLLEHPRVDVNMLDKLGRGAIHYCMDLSDPFLATLVSSPRIDVNLGTGRTKELTPIWMAVNHCNRYGVEVILGSGKHVDLKTKFVGHTPHEYARKRGYLQTARLIERHALQDQVLIK